MSKEKKSFSNSAIEKLGSSSEVTETKEAEKVDEIITRKKVKKTHTNISVSISIAEYNYFIKYLNDNEITSPTSELIREALRDKGFLPPKVK